MAVAIASSSTNTAVASSSIVITKPTGLAVGDLMIACIHMYWTGGDREVNLASGWTTIAVGLRIHNGGENNGTAMGSMYKIADSSDVAASDFTFSTTGTGSLAGCVLRITGMSPSAPINTHNETATDNGGSGGSFSFSGITPTFADCMLLLFAGTRNSTSHSTYAIATSNPSWTELFDISATFSLAYAIRPETTATGNASYAIGGAGSGTDALGTIIAIKPATDVTVSPSVINSTGTVQTPTISGGATVSPSTINATGAVLTPADAGQADWSAQDKSDTATWTNQSKS